MKALLAALVLGLLLANASDISSCGPFFPEAVFTRSKGPDDESAFFSGRLGILKPTYERRYLAMAYRILRGEQLNAAQRTAVTGLERFRTSDVDDAVNQWLAARKEVKGAAPVESVDLYRRTDFFHSLPSCGSDAFVTARKSLQERIREAGADSAEVRDWLHAQDQVFLSCAGGPYVPAAAPPGSSERVRADRAYQIAAAYFYAGDLETARNAWRVIAADTQSPWRTLAPYLIARAYLREEKNTEAEAQLKSVLADKAEASIHRQARNLLDYVLARSDPGSQLLTLSNRLMEPNPVDLGRDLNDYTFLYDRLERGSTADFGSNKTDAQMQASLNRSWDGLKEAAARSDLTEWIMEFQNKTPVPHTEVKRWRETRSQAWLLAARNWVDPNSQDERDVLEALLAVPASSPAYATARFDAAEMLAVKNRNTESANVLDEILAHPAETAKFDTSTLNAFRQERMRVARTFDEFLTYAPRVVTVIEDDGDFANPAVKPRGEEPLSFDSDAAFAFNSDLPLSLWRKSITSRSLPANLRSEIAQSGLVRTIVLGESPGAFASELSALKPSYSSSIAGFSPLKDEEQRFASVFWILHHPELTPYVMGGLPRITKDGRIDEYRLNWWCADLPTGAGLGEPAKPKEAFLTPAEQEENAHEQAALHAAANAPPFLASVVVAWAKAHPGDSRNAEALALAVRSSRYSCSSAGGHGDSVARAFELLHQRYPNTSWAKMTPYWY